jgi:hypothetical protein
MERSGTHALLSAVVLICLGQMPAAGMTARDILDLSQFESQISKISWCNGDSLIFAHATKPSSLSWPPRSWAPPGWPVPERDGALSISMLSGLTSTTPTVESITELSRADSANCLRNGEYLFVSGQLIEARQGKGPDALRRRYNVEGGPFHRYTPQTARDGSVFGQDGRAQLGLNRIDPAAREDFLKSNRSYAVRQGEIYVSVLKTEPRTPEQFPIYDLAAPETWNIGSFQCSAPRPDCPPAAAGKQETTYYIYSKYNTANKRVDAVFTIRPQRRPVVSRWPVTARAGAAWDKLEIMGVALDETRCFVLLHPNDWHGANRIDGRLRLDLLIARCRFTAGRLEFDTPRVVGRKQGSYVWPKLRVHGELVVIEETLDMNAQPEDQQQFEPEASSAGVSCVHILRSNRDNSWTTINVICARRDGDWSKQLIVSPDGNFVAVQGKSGSFIVGRDYRNDGTGPSWITHGSR